MDRKVVVYHLHKDGGVRWNKNTPMNSRAPRTDATPCMLITDGNRQSFFRMSHVSKHYRMSIVSRLTPRKAVHLHQTSRRVHFATTGAGQNMYKLQFANV